MCIGQESVCGAQSCPNQQHEGVSAVTDIQIIYDGHVVNRKDAMDIGLTRYFTGKPCKHGHVDERFVNNRTCVSCKHNSDSRWASKNRDAVRRKHKSWRDKNRDHVNKYSRDWSYHNKEKASISQRSSKARRRGAEGKYNKKDITRILDRQKWKCAEPRCSVSLRKSGYHVDHIMPLVLGGSNWPDNLQCLCPRCNLSKGAKHPIEWAIENGRLI